MLNFSQIYSNHGVVADWIWSTRTKIQYAVKIAYGHDDNRKNKTDKRSIEPTFRYCIKYQGYPWQNCCLHIPSIVQYLTSAHNCYLFFFFTIVSNHAALSRKTLIQSKMSQQVLAQIHKPSVTHDRIPPESFNELCMPIMN